MNQLREWTGNCQRCGQKTDVHTMSMFDVALICINCCEGEQRLDSYQAARNAERKALKSGDRNFKGIGYPDTDKD